MCSTHYSYWQRANTALTLTCKQCGGSFQYHRKDKKTCSTICHQSFTLTTEGHKARMLAAKVNAKPQPKLKTQAEIEAGWLAQRSDLRAAYEDGDRAMFFAALKERSRVTDSGCWEWLGKATKSNKGGIYPAQRWAGKSYQVHRLSIEMDRGAALGVLAAHHKCANSICVNPEHLQPVTYRENTAEMMARNSLERRIKELEKALHSVCPDHEALNRIPVAA